MLEGEKGDDERRRGEKQQKETAKIEMAETHDD